MLVLGGTMFLSRAVAEEALRRGHDVTCACRGVSGTVPDGATHVVWDRGDQETPAELAAASFDSVVDVARHPSHVRSAVAAFPDAHWTFVSTINVYSDDTIPNGTADTLPLHDPVHTDEDPTASPELYGAMKVSCEQSVLEGAASAMIVRPGLIVGPGDPTGRFSYWPARLADGGEVLAPGSPDDAVQVIDVRDLAVWIVDAAEARTTGVYTGTSHVMTRGEFLAQMADGLGVEPHLTWVDQEFLAEQEVEPWMGPRALPVWLPLPEYAGLMAHDVRASYDAGLATRPIGDTARDTLAWLRDHPDAASTGIGREDEAEVLRAWHARTR
jgi:nucleoside-diphosphate-sugar epimerase